MGSNCCKRSRNEKAASSNDADGGQKLEAHRTNDDEASNMRSATAASRSSSASGLKGRSQTSLPSKSAKMGAPTAGAVSQITTLSQLTQVVNKLGISMYRKVEAAQHEKNIVFSPLSVALALAAVETGASNQTRQEVQQLIGSSGSDATYGKLYGALLGQILELQEKDGQLGMATSFFHDAKLSVREEYASNVKQWFKADINTAPFTSDPETARQQVNRWVSDKTMSKVAELFEKGRFNASTAFVLASAVCMKMHWEIPFDLEKTARSQFRRFGGTKEQSVPFMSQSSEDIGYAKRENLQVVELPYSGQRMSMYIVVPKHPKGLGEIEKTLDSDQLIELFKAAQPSPHVHVHLQMPKFAMRQPINMLPVFADLGFRTFNQLGQMSNDAHAAISDAVHETYIVIDEKGRDGALTSLFEKKSRLQRPRFVPVAVDHPFLFAAVHKPTWTIACMGRVNYVEEEK